MVKVEITKTDAQNIGKWITATSMMIEAKMRTPFSQSEHDTWSKFNNLR